MKWRSRSWRDIAKLQSKPSTVSDNCPILHSDRLDFYDRVNFPRFEKIARQGKNLPAFVLENVGISYIPDLRYIFKLQSLFLDCVCASEVPPYVGKPYNLRVHGFGSSEDREIIFIHTNYL